MDNVSCSAVARASSPEVCDGIDNDCNGMVDDGVGTFWFPDCDGDGYAPQGVGTKSCSKPDPVNGCGWTQREPTGAGAADCDDHLAARHPGADFGLPISQEGAGLPPPRDFAYDLNCDGTQEGNGSLMSTGKITNGHLEMVDFCQSATCTPGVTCISQVTILGEIVCGGAYPYDTNCSSKVTVYFLCR